jgi:hypothetical protein
LSRPASATEKHLQIYFDESGDFNTASRAGYKFAFVVGVSLPDRALAGFKTHFDWFVGQLQANEFDQGEPKGSLLSLARRKMFMEILKSHRDVMLIPVSMNLGYGAALCRMSNIRPRGAYPPPFRTRVQPLTIVANCFPNSARTR